MPSTHKVAEAAKGTERGASGDKAKEAADSAARGAEGTTTRGATESDTKIDSARGAVDIKTGDNARGFVNTKAGDSARGAAEATPAMITTSDSPSGNKIGGAL